MKKFLATLIASILAAGGFVFMDSTIPERVESLENEISSLREQVSSLEADSDEYHVGDEICCFPKNKNSFAVKDEFGEKTITITEFSAEITHVFDNATTLEEHIYPYRGIATIKGTADIAESGNQIYFHITGTYGKSAEQGEQGNGFLIKSDGSFEARINLYFSDYVKNNAALEISGFTISEAIQ